MQQPDSVFQAFAAGKHTPRTHMGPSHRDEFPAQIDRCVFVDGVHVYSGVFCPHENDRDEQGEVKPAGWTVQQ